MLAEKNSRSMMVRLRRPHGLLSSQYILRVNRESIEKRGVRLQVPSMGVN
jgi:hypothetical protein